MIYVTLAGGLMSIDPNRFRAAARPDRPQGPSRIMLAGRYRSLGRTFKQERRFDEAEAAWRQALDLLTGVLNAKPNSPEQRLEWCDCANDLAWLRANHPDLARRDPDAAVAMARRIVEKCPDAEAYWNTLGVAYFRAGDDARAVAALDRAMTLGGGTAFDEIFLAMAHARLGDLERARLEFNRAIVTAERDYPRPPGSSLPNATKPSPSSPQDPAQPTRLIDRSRRSSAGFAVPNPRSFTIRKPRHRRLWPLLFLPFLGLLAGLYLETTQRRLPFSLGRLDPMRSVALGLLAGCGAMVSSASVVLAYRVSQRRPVHDRCHPGTR